MASSFAAYASQFLTNARGNGNSNTGTESGVEPLFYSFTTSEGSDSSSEERGIGMGIGRGNGRGTGIGNGIGMGRGTGRGDEYDFDTDDPHLGSGSGTGSGYGWLAHQGYEAGDPREEGEDEGEDRESESESQDGSEDGDLPSGLIASGLRIPTRTNNAFDSLSESLLPSRSEPTSFNLPSPRRRRRRRKTQDAVWTWIWGGCVCVCYLSALVCGSGSGSNTRIGSRVLLTTLPLLIPLIFLSAFASYLHIVFLRLWMRPVMFLSALGTPLLLLGSGVWGLLASYSTSDYSVLSLRLLSLLPLLTCIYLLHRLYTLYIAFPHLIAQVNHTHALLSLSTFLLFAYPHPTFPSLLLPLLSPLLLLSFLLLSIPFAIVISTAPTPWTLFAAAVWVWTWGVTRGVLRVTTAAVVGGWYYGVPWAPSVSRDLEFGRDLHLDLGRDLDLGTDLDLDSETQQAWPPLPSPSSPPSLLLLSALTRASHSSLGSIVVSALRETTLCSLSFVIRVLLLGVPALLFSLISLFSGIVPSPVSPLRLVRLSPVVGFLRIPLSPLTHFLTNLIPHPSPFPQIYIALTGVSYRTATLRVSRSTFLTSGNLGGLGGLGGLLLSPLSPPLSLPLPFALITYYIFVSHSPHTNPPTNTQTPALAPLEAWQASLLAALTTALVGIFCVGVLRDVGDALWVCWVGDTGRTCETETGETGARGEMGRGEEEARTGTEIGLRLGTGIKERRDLVARVFEYPSPRDTRDVPGTSREEVVDSLLPPDTDTDGEVEAEVIHIHQIPREGIPYPHPPPSPIPSIPPIPQRYVPLKQGREAVVPPSARPLLSDSHDLTDDEDINPFHHSPNPSASSAPYPAPYPAPSAPPPSSRPPSSRPPAVSAPIRSSSSSLSSLSSSGEMEEGGFFGSGLFG